MGKVRNLFGWRLFVGIVGATFLVIGLGAAIFVTVSFVRDASLRALPAGSLAEPMPDAEEMDRDRSFGPVPDADMTLTVPALGIEDAPVFSSDSEDVLDDGVMHVPETSMPWDAASQEQSNVYLAGHRLGWPGTPGRLIFYHLDKLKPGDVVTVEGRGETYRYRVAEKFVVEPDDRWVMGQVIDHHILTLQTCTLPALRERIIVRADRM